jgi:GrpB-like predicted nucleotidyltransferase (UPF0157 family)
MTLWKFETSVRIYYRSLKFDREEVKSIPPHPDPIVVVPYDPAWPQVYEQEKEILAKALGSLVLSINYIGSTAVPCLAAKPIVDILAGVPTLLPLSVYEDRLRPLGYVFQFHDREEGRLFFRKGMPRTHHLHIMEQDSEGFRHHLFFRDCLRLNPDLADEYAELKRRLAQRYRENRAAYVSGKADWIRHILSR